MFGGLLIGQALRAAALTLTTPIPARSLHASFLVAGRGGEELLYDVERTRDGASFSTRRVLVRHNTEPVLVLTADFHAPEHGAEFQQSATTSIPGPDGLKHGRYNNPYVESRDVPVGDDELDDRAPSAQHTRHAWFRVTETLPPDDAALHQHALAYLSDHGPTRAAREPHAHLADDAQRQSVSLDHSVWFHRPVNVNEWMLSELVPISTGSGRGLTTGSLRTADGTLVASVAQEVLLRTRTK